MKMKNSKLPEEQLTLNTDSFAGNLRYHSTHFCNVKPGIRRRILMVDSFNTFTVPESSRQFQARGDYYQFAKGNNYY